MTGSRTTGEERDEARFANRGGVAFLVVHGATWIAASLLTFVLDVEQAALVYLFQGVVAFPASLLLERLLGYRLLTGENSLRDLSLQLAFIQLLALPASIIAFNLDPLYLPATFAATSGGHFLPYAWLHRTRVYVVLAIVASLAPFGLVLFGGGQTSFTYSGFVVGTTLIVAGLLIRARIERELTGSVALG